MSQDAPQRLHFLDGLRGLAGLYVLLFHEATAKVEGDDVLSPPLQLLQGFLKEGRHSVVFFIVLSGFSLMLPIARSGASVLVGGFRRYLYRRARRILPPYYAALFFSLAMVIAYNKLGAHSDGTGPLDAALRPGAIVSHLFLVHNLSFDWAFRINGPMWSVATEWQIYFLFGLLLLPLRRFIGGGATVLIAWIVSSLPTFLLPVEMNLWWASPWFVGSFALGMYGADIGFLPSAGAPRRPLPWVALTWLSFLCVALIAVVEPSWPYPAIDLPVSLFAFCWINAGVQLTNRGAEQKSLMLRVLGSRALVYLGGFSYSLYLVQHPLLRLSEKVFNHLELSRDANLVLHLLVVTPVVMAVAWVFSELFERPFTSGGTLLPALRRQMQKRELA